MPSSMPETIEGPPYVVRFSNIKPVDRDIFHKALTDVLGATPKVLLEPGDEVVVTSDWKENDLRRAMEERINLLKALAAASR